MARDVTGDMTGGHPPNLSPARYRSVSVAHVDVPLQLDALNDHFVGREAYRRTRFLVVRRGEECAVVRVTKESEEPLFSPIVGLELLAGPLECVVVVAPEVDTAVPSQLGDVARRLAPGVRCVVVEGRYGHVSFLLDPQPVRVRVVDIVPPVPAKLVDQVRRVLDVADDLPPVELVPHVIDLHQLARTRPARTYLFPCRVSGADAGEGSATAFLDQRPPRAPWVLVGCARSREIHRWLYGEDAEAVDMCPRTLAPDDGVPTLTKCCLLEYGIEQRAHLTLIPWGATLEEVKRGLGALLEALEPTWVST